VHELKFDGYRCLVSVGGGNAHAFTRSGLGWSDKFAPVVEDAIGLSVRSALIDGEAVVVDVGGKTNFQALQSAIKGEPQRMEFYAFDLLGLDGEDLTSLPLLERKERLAGVLKGHAGPSTIPIISSAKARRCSTSSAARDSKALYRNARMPPMSGRAGGRGSRPNASSARSSSS
jgi:ATP-dependent DNA ligase